MTKSWKKEARLSPRAKELIEDIRKRFPKGPIKGEEYLKSIDPKSFNLYDRHKIGREILRKVAQYDGVTEGIEWAYDVIAPQNKEDYAEIDRIVSPQNQRLAYKKAGDEKFSFTRSQNVTGERYAGYWDAGVSYEFGGFLKKALHSYEEAIDDARTLHC